MNTQHLALTILSALLIMCTGCGDNTSVATASATISSTPVTTKTSEPTATPPTPSPTPEIVLPAPTVDGATVYQTGSIYTAYHLPEGERLGPWSLPYFQDNSHITLAINDTVVAFVRIGDDTFDFTHDDSDQLSAYSFFQIPAIKGTQFNWWVEHTDGSDTPIECSVELDNGATSRDQNGTWASDTDMYNVNPDVVMTDTVGTLYSIMPGFQGGMQNSFRTREG